MSLHLHEKEVYYIFHSCERENIPISGQILHSGPTVVPILPQRGFAQQASQRHYQREYCFQHQQGITLLQTSVWLTDKVLKL